MFNFSTNWLSPTLQGIWTDILLSEKPTKLLEIGSFEGRSAVFMIQTLAAFHPIELHCIDPWTGSREHEGMELSSLQQRFQENVAIAEQSVPNEANVKVYPTSSDIALPIILSNLGQGYFDFIYIDGSHEAADVLFDAVVAFKLLRSGGVMVFDDYLWHNNPAEIIRAPKIAIDAFVNTHFDKLQVYGGVPYQLIIKKL